jgi:PKD repeat protein
LVDWTNESTGTVESYHWDFGDGQTSSAASPTYIYMQPGTYPVTLTVSGPGGTDSKTYSESIVVTGESPYFTQGPFPVDDSTDTGAIDGVGESDGECREFPIEYGELDVDSAGRWVTFEPCFDDPVVIAKVVSTYDVDPVVVIIDDVDSSGFSIRLREWDYLDDAHATEKVYYVVVERGRHQLPDGAWIEADRVDVAKINSFGSTIYSEPFTTKPVVLTTVSGYNGAKAVTTRVQKVGLDGFEAQLQTQEADKKLRSRVAGTIAYIAWEPSSVELNGFQVEVDRMVEGISHAPTTMEYALQSERQPVLLADMQTTNGSDTASLRVVENDAASVEVWVQEEQSKDRETKHVTEEVGYLVILR